MVELPKTVRATNSFRKAWNRLVLWLRQSRLRSSKDIKVNVTPDGTTLTLAKDPTKDSLTYFYATAYKPHSIDASGDIREQYDLWFYNHLAKFGNDAAWYDPTASYGVGSIVRVKEDTFVNGMDPITGNPLTSSAGAYVCVSPVPGLMDFIQSASVAAQVETLSTDYDKFVMRKTVRQPKTVYWPLWPEPKILDRAYLSGSTYATPIDYTEAQGRFWEKIGSLSTPEPASEAKPYYVAALSHSFLVCNEVLAWSASAAGNPTGSFVTNSLTLASSSTYVAKPFNLRNYKRSLSVDGITFTYTPNGGDTNRRTASGSFNSELQVVTPRYTTFDVIYAMPAKTGVFYSGSTECTHVDVNNDSRWWMKDN